MRQCGPCQACCTLPEIPELGKAAGEPCKHLTPNGCGIYEQRPQTCRDFECGWKMRPGYKDDERPDLVRIMVAGFKHDQVQMNIAHELSPGAFDSWKGDKLVKRESKHDLLGLRPYGAGTGLDEVMLAGPRRLIGRIDAATAKRKGTQ